MTGSSGPWSDAIRLSHGPQQGERGRDSYAYVAYASDVEGTSISLVPSNSLKWRAEIHLAEEAEELTAADFAGKWVKYIGDDGAGVDGLIVSAYDTDGDGGKNNFGSSLGSRDNSMVVGRRGPAAFFLPKKRRFRGRGVVQRMAGMSK